MKKLFAGAISVIALIWFFFTSSQKNTLSSTDLKNQEGKLQSYLSEALILTKQASQNKTPTAFTMAQTQDMYKKVLTIQQNLQQKTPDTSIRNPYSKTLQITNTFLHLLAQTNMYAGNTYQLHSLYMSVKPLSMAIENINQNL